MKQCLIRAALRVLLSVDQGLDPQTEDLALLGQPVHVKHSPPDPMPCEVIDRVLANRRNLLTREHSATYAVGSNRVSILAIIGTAKGRRHALAAN
jgi:hypothetical protein